MYMLSSLSNQPYPGFFYTGDGAARDEHGYIWIKGRIDGKILFLWFKVKFKSLIDVINVSGHRLSTAEIESALILHKGVAETAGLCLIDMCSSVTDHMHAQSSELLMS